MIHNYVAYAPKNFDKNIGRVYNQFMELVAEDDWVCYIDHDSMMTTPEWYKMLEEAVETIQQKNLPIGLLTAVTNRIGNNEQIIFDKNSPEAQNHDMYFHRKVGQERMKKYGLSARVAMGFISGIVMLTPKRVWEQCGGFKEGFLGVDNDYDRKVRKCGYDTCIMDGLYVYHWYRADGLPLQGYGYPAETNLAPVR
jgi:GT2 family glycosyltransferase